MNRSESEEPLFFKIGEAASRVGVSSSMIRSWTKEFPQIQACRVGGRHRLFRAEDIRLFLEIKRLLQEERFTVEGARRKLAEESARTLFDSLPPGRPKSRSGAKGSQALTFEDVRRELVIIRRLLEPASGPGAAGSPVL
ncbi:MAG: MerR family transcriptional regulator [Deltaproteobacteria bacterium]|jgi:excisionase family DNA binding protein|nr:MerR family transcriptional regulator [Deltaproteobacteria bacterium]